MKLAEALLNRADLQKRAAQLESRLVANARVQEGEAPAEDPRRLLEELDEVIARLQELIGRINHTNAATVDGDATLTELLAQRDCLAMQVGVLRNFLTAASNLAPRATHSEIRIHSTVKVSELQKQVDGLSKALRELDTRIQSLNWTTELI